MAKNLFAKAKKTKKASAKKDDKLMINVSGEEFAEKLTKFATLKAQMDELKSELAMSQAFVKEIGTNEFAKLFETKKVNIGSFIMTSDDGGRVMVLPTKKYIKIDESGAEMLQETYGEDIVTENTKYGFNTKILMKNMDVISDLIQESTDISEEDKENLIEATTTYSVEKDALDKVYTLAQETKTEVLEVIEDLQPVIMLKSAKAGTMV
jgi:hypothetical protein